MFCRFCGKEITGKYCGECGKDSSVNKEDDSGKVKTFNDFLKERSKSRTTTLPQKRKIDIREVKESTIFASILRRDEGDNLKQEKGSRLPIKVNTDWGPYPLKQAVFEKFQRYHRNFHHNKISDFKLVYKSGEVIKYIPGTKTEFSVKKYKEDLGVGYHSIVVYLMEYMVSTDSEDNIEDCDDNDLPNMLDIYNESSAISSDPVISSASVLYDHSYVDSRICQVCFCTSKLNGKCLICSQNKEYQASLAIDSSSLRSTGSSTVTSNTVAHDAFSHDEPQLSPASIRRARLERFNDSTDEVVLVKNLEVHRLHLREELMKLFSDSSIMDFQELNFTVIDARGQKESGIGQGVTKDVMCTVFNELSNSHMIGFSEKVPSIRHDMSRTAYTYIEFFFRCIFFIYIKVMLIKVFLNFLFKL